DNKVEVPIVDKRTGQVVALSGDSVSVMDNQTLEIVEVPLPKDENLRAKIEPGVSVEYWSIMNRYLLVNVK
ncbi:MAG: hypothetical protein QW570_06215, partial [Candidatus Caldarchaeum sp.]